MLRIAYCGYDYYANCLAALLERNDVQVLKVYACGKGENRRYSREVVRLAKEHRLPFCFNPIDRKEVERLFNQCSCDYILSAGYSDKIPIGEYRGLNIHPTLLPLGRGPWPFPMIILEGHKQSGVTIHKLTDKFDAGDIVLQRSFPLDEEETQDTLHCKNQILGLELLKEWLDKPEELWDRAVPQGKGTYWKRPGDVERTITPEMRFTQIRRTVRAFEGAGVFLKTNGGTWYAQNVVCQNSGRPSDPPGTILYEQNGYLVVAAAEGVLYAICVRRADDRANKGKKRSVVWRVLRKGKTFLRLFR